MKIIKDFSSNYYAVKNDILVDGCHWWLALKFSWIKQISYLDENYSKI